MQTSGTLCVGVLVLHLKQGKKLKLRYIFSTSKLQVDAYSQVQEKLP